MKEKRKKEAEEKPIRIFARVDAAGFVTRFLDTVHFADEILETDIFVEEGFGDAYAYPHARAEGALIPRSREGCHNFRLENGAIRETTAEERAAELAGRPGLPMTGEEAQAEQNLDFDYRLSMLELGL